MADDYQDLYNHYYISPSLGVLTDTAMKGNTQLLEALLANGANVNEVDFTGNTPLIQAIVNGHADIVKMLIKHHVDVNQPDEDGEAPLLAALQYNQPVILQDLLDAGADASVFLSSVRGQNLIDNIDQIMVKAFKDQLMRMELVSRERLASMPAPREEAPQKEEPALFNGEKLADVFDSSKWTGKIEKMQRLWDEVPAPLKETFDFETALVEARRQTLLTRAPKAPVLKPPRFL